jgi:hypothetical protein
LAPSKKFRHHKLIASQTALPVLLFRFFNNNNLEGINHCHSYIAGNFVMTPDNICPPEEYNCHKIWQFVKAYYWTHQISTLLILATSDLLIAIYQGIWYQKYAIVSIIN